MYTQTLKTYYDEQPPFLQMLPYRDSIVYLVGRRDVSSLSNLAYYTVTYGTILVVFGLGMAIQDIWMPLQLIGATGSLIAFLFPAVLAFDLAGGLGSLLKACRHHDSRGLEPCWAYWVAGGMSLMLVGVWELVTGLVAVFLSYM